MKKFSIVSFCLLASMMMSSAQMASDTLYHEKYRPQYHFSPKHGWIGDPSGLMYYQGKYHMFWWGKVESTDLVHYNEVSPNVMKDVDKNIACFTGSVLIDKQNSAGYGKDAYIAALTVFERDSKKQAQGIAFSHDGKTFHHYDGNPVLDIWSTEFRDPTVFWSEQKQKWVMVVAKALEKKVKFYESDDLKHWTWTSDFGPSGDSEKSWECPDLFQVPVDGDWNNRKWVLVVSVNWAQEQYFIGDFDGKKFTLMDNHPTEPLYIDKGMDYYASRTFRDYDGTQREVVSMGWVATWDYAPHVPSTYGKGFWSIPRVLNLKSYPEGLRMTQLPVKGLETLRGKEHHISGSMMVGSQSLRGFRPKQNVYELDALFSTATPNTFGFHLCVGNGRKVVISYDTESHNLMIDRTNTADCSIVKFSRVAHALVEPQNGQLRLHIYVDKSSIEIFANDGKDVFTLQTFPSDEQTGIETFALRKGTKMELKVWELNTIWQ